MLSELLVRSGSPADDDAEQVPAKLVGRGGQLLLLERAPFCPIRDCQKRCGPGTCTCKPCRCEACRERTRRARGRLPRPVLNLRAAPRMDFSVQRRLFDQPQPLIRPRRRTP